MSYTPHDPANEHEPLWDRDDPRECALCAHESTAKWAMDLAIERAELFKALERVMEDMTPEHLKVLHADPDYDFHATCTVCIGYAAIRKAKGEVPATTA